MIKAHELSKSYSGKLAVDNLSFEVKPGKVTGFLGPNGAGKSTTMRLMLGLDNGHGSTTYDGKLLHEYDELSKVVGVLLEAKAFHPTRSAKNHLKVLAIAGNIPIKRVDEVLGIVGLADVANKRPGKFSLGMSQRLGVAAAILGEPKYLILDEPGNGLDPEGIAWLRQFLRDYIAHEDRGVFVSSHLLSEVSQLADNVVVIGKGKLIADTSIKKLVTGAHSSVFVRVSKIPLLEKALKDRNIEFEREQDGVVVNTTNTDEIGKIAHEAKTVVLELAARTASLEDAFLELTEQAEEFQGQKEEKK
jgi:ABC-2 type transport system ATP-binding protein